MNGIPSIISAGRRHIVILLTGRTFWATIDVEVALWNLWQTLDIILGKDVNMNSLSGRMILMTEKHRIRNVHKHTIGAGWGSLAKFKLISMGMRMIFHYDAFLRGGWLKGCSWSVHFLWFIQGTTRRPEWLPLLLFLATTKTRPEFAVI